MLIQLLPLNSKIAIVIPNNWLAPCPYIHAITQFLFGNSIATVGMQAFSLPLLEYLICQTMKLRGWRPPRLRVSPLKGLWLQDNRIGKFDYGALAAMSHLETLRLDQQDETNGGQDLSCTQAVCAFSRWHPQQYQDGCLSETIKDAVDLCGSDGSPCLGCAVACPATDPGGCSSAVPGPAPGPPPSPAPGPPPSPAPGPPLPPRTCLPVRTRQIKRPGEFLGLRMEFEMTVELRVGEQVIGQSTAVEFHGSPTLQRPVIAPMHNFTLSSTVFSDDEVEMVVRIVPKRAAVDPKKMAAANLYAECLSGQDGSAACGSPCFSSETVVGSAGTPLYAAVAFVGNVDVSSGPDGTTPTYLGAVCPSLGHGLLRNLTEQTAELIVLSARPEHDPVPEAGAVFRGVPDQLWADQDAADRVRDARGADVELGLRARRRRPIAPKGRAVYPGPVRFRPKRHLRFRCRVTPAPSIRQTAPPKRAASLRHACRPVQQHTGDRGGPRPSRSAPRTLQQDKVCTPSQKSATRRRRPCRCGTNWTTKSPFSRSTFIRLRLPRRPRTACAATQRFAWQTGFRQRLSRTRPTRGTAPGPAPRAPAPRRPPSSPRTGRPASSGAVAFLWRGRLYL